MRKSIRGAVLAFFVIPLLGCTFQTKNGYVVGVGYESRTRFFSFQEQVPVEGESEQKVTVDKEVMKDEDQSGADEPDSSAE